MDGYSGKSPLWSPDSPPTLRNVPFGTIGKCFVVAGDLVTSRALFAMNPWEELKRFGGKPRILNPFITNEYFGIDAHDGRYFPNPGGEIRRISDMGTEQFWEADISHWSEWHRITTPMTESSDRSVEVTETITNELSSLESYSREIAASVSATANYNGLVASASVTATLSTSFSDSVSEQRTLTTSKEYKTTKQYKAHYAYVDWHKYDVYEVSYRHDIIVPEKAPFTSDQLNAINPGRLRYAVLSAIWNDSCPVDELFKG